MCCLTSCILLYGFNFLIQNFISEVNTKGSGITLEEKPRQVKGEFRLFSLTFAALLLISQGKKIVEAIRDSAVFQ